MKLAFGKHKGKDITEVPVEYLWWLSSNNENPKGSKFKIPQPIVDEARKLLKALSYRKNRLIGMPGTTTEYIIEGRGDLHFWDDSLEKVFSSLNGALKALKVKAGYNIDPEDDMVVIWEVTASGHRKIVWGFFGWHWASDEFVWDKDGWMQSSYPEDSESVYAKAERDC